MENGAQVEENKTRGVLYCMAGKYLLLQKALKTARSDYFSSLLEKKNNNPKYLFNTVAKLKQIKASTGVDIFQKHSSNNFVNYFTSKIDTIRDKIVTSHQ